MKLIPISLFALFFIVPALAQQNVEIAFRSGNFVPQRNISNEELITFNRSAKRINGKILALIQFDKPLRPAEITSLRNSGLQILEYIPGNTYSIYFNSEPDHELLKKSGAVAIFQLDARQKQHPRLLTGDFPVWSTRSPGAIDVWISFPSVISADEVEQYLAEKNIEIVSSDYEDYRVLGIRLSVTRLNELASFPFIEYVEPAPHGDQILNGESRTNARANILSSPTGLGGYNLKGEGIMIGVGDNADPQYHVDFTERLINFGPAGYFLHGTHVHGTVGGGGIRMEEHTGYAPKSRIITQNFSGIIKNTPAYVSSYGMVITNNSYGDVVGDCSYAGTYDLQSRVTDQQLIDHNNLIHVFAAGNDGTRTCVPYGTGFRTVLGAYQSAKNVLDVGAVNRLGVVTSFSSRGPVKDGRIKPEIMADGFFTSSTVPDDTYSILQGTSMAAPAVAGGMALLYERYRQLNSGANPPGALMKAIMVNGAYDRGNPGPDFTYGFGSMNLLRSIDMLNNARYFSGSLTQGGSANHVINVPANTAQLKVMLYWHDPVAAIYAQQTLVNDLDVQVTTPSSSTVLPWVLDTLPANVNNNATTGADHINNIEQVTITNPSSGNHTVTINGTTIGSGSQQYYLVYDLIPIETTLIYPRGGEAFNPGDSINIQWEAYGDPNNTFTLEYSLNNGSSWTVINASVTSNLRRYPWFVPSAITDQAMVRISRNGTGMISTGQAFTIIGTPAIQISSTQCEGYIALDWPAVTSATDYEVFMLQGSEMISIATTALTNYTITGLDPRKQYWVSVRARLNSNPGKRASALTRTPNSGSCTGTISDYDLRMDTIMSPKSGRLNTSTALTPSTQITARFKNLDDAAVNSFTMRYYVNGVLQASEPVVSTVNAGATYTHTFTSTYDFSAAAVYVLRVEVINDDNPDPVSLNNSVIDTIRQIINNVITLPFTDNIESAQSRWYYAARFGVEGISRYDYTNTDPLGRLSTYIHDGMANSGNRSLILDFDGWNGGVGNTNFLTGTYNLTGLNASTQDIRLDFQFKTHGDLVNHADNRVWIRGSDSQPWLVALDLSSLGIDPGIFVKTTSIELSDILAAGGQNFSSSFQVRWGQYGIVRINDNEGFQGHNFDDIRLYEAIDDISLISIDTPIVNSCGLSAAVPVRITIRNASLNPINNIPVRLVVNGVTIATEIIVINPSGLAPNTTYTYTFAATANLSVIGDHSVEVIVEYPTDNFAENNSLTTEIINSPVVNSFPYLEDFESGNGNWYAGGSNSSWEYGTPSSLKIRSAASGTKAWKTRLTGAYNQRELSYLYSPCFDLTGMTVPTLSMSISLDLEDCGGTFCDGAYVEYSEDGITWNRLGAFGTGTNWYNKNYSGNPLWSVQNYTRWHVVTSALPVGISNLRLRIVLNTDPFVAREGVGIDDIHIYDNTMGIYDGATLSSPINQNIPGGNSWIDFSSGGKLVASIQPAGQNLGSTDVQVYINTVGVRNDSKQYYHNRNITIKPANVSLADSSIIRFYFLDSETEALISASGCSSCTKPASAYELGVTKYSDPDDQFENGTLADNANGVYSYSNAYWNRKVPFDRGYYVEFRVKDFSEFWLNNGGPDGLHALPVELISFTAKKVNKTDAILEWITATEQNASKFEVEVARGNEDYTNNRFQKIGELPAIGNSSSQVRYDLTDLEPGKSGIRYYRLKLIDNDGTFFYSQIRPLSFEPVQQYQVYPNPSTGIFQVIHQTSAGELINFKIYDAAGRLLRSFKLNGTGFMEKTEIDLEGYAHGIYLLKIEMEERSQNFKLILK